MSNATSDGRQNTPVPSNLEVRKAGLNYCVVVPSACETEVIAMSAALRNGIVLTTISAPRHSFRDKFDPRIAVEIGCLEIVNGSVILALFTGATSADRAAAGTYANRFCVGGANPDPHCIESFRRNGAIGLRIWLAVIDDYDDTAQALLEACDLPEMEPVR